MYKLMPAEVDNEYIPSLSSHEYFTSAPRNSTATESVKRRPHLRNLTQ